MSGESVVRRGDHVAIPIENPLRWLGKRIEQDGNGAVGRNEGCGHAAGKRAAIGSEGTLLARRGGRLLLLGMGDAERIAEGIDRRSAGGGCNGKGAEKRLQRHQDGDGEGHHSKIGRAHV